MGSTSFLVCNFKSLLLNIPEKKIITMLFGNHRFSFLLGMGSQAVAASSTQNPTEDSSNRQDLDLQSAQLLSALSAPVHGA